MKLTSYGAAEGVTGSCHILDVGDKRVMLDCGIFQGIGAGEKNAPPLPFDPTTIDALIVSHAHLDHVGRIPLLRKEKFYAPIISTRATYELARINLLDSARILDYDARRANRKRKRGEPRVEPIFDEEDVLDALDLWGEYAEYEERVEVCEGVAVTFHDAGHILGSAFLELELTEGDETRRVIFSGDLGNVDKPIIKDPQDPPQADVLILESTYGDRDHRPFHETRAELIAAINETFERGGNALIPSFALERAQELLYVLYEAWRDEQIPKWATIYLDSPMAIDATRIFARHPDCYDAEAIKLTQSGVSPFRFRALNYSRHTDESMRINDHSAGAIIIAGSGMMTGGRILHHLRRNLDRPECSLIVCGFQALGTLGRELVNGAMQVEIHQHVIPVRAKLHTINGFSAHADQGTMTDWAKKTHAARILLVHGEPEVKENFAAHLEAHTDAERVEIMGFDAPVDL